MTPPAGLPAGGHPGVVAAGAGDLDTLSHVIADAFHDLAPSQWLISDPGARRQIFPGYFRLYLEHALAAGVVHTTPGRTAAALWLPAGQGAPAQPGDYEARLAAATGPWAERFAAFDAALDARLPTIAHHHLAILAVRPDRQGQGIGTALLRAHHATLDQDATPAYLEASSQRSRALYQRHGYTDHGQPIHLPEDGPPLMWPMWRPGTEPPARPISG